MEYCVVCNDAGGANQIYAMLHTFKKMPKFVILDGQAKFIWKEKFPKYDNFESDFKKISEVDIVITGTGWESDLEHDARIFARLNKKIYYGN